MDENELFETLVESGVLSTREDGEVRPSSEFESTVSRYGERIRDETDRRDALVAVDTPSGRVADFVSVAEEAPDFVARYLAVRDVAEALGFVESVRVVILLDRFSGPTPPTEGSPEPFLPVAGERLPAMLGIFPVAVVYVWRERCPDCDEMRDALEAVFERGHDSVTLLSVYGPDCAEMLEERYDVVGGPTTLFAVDGTVDSRLQGAHVEEVVEREVDNSLTTAEMRGVR
jgi:thiol-disulfide isomerase/thioredoxin